MLCFAAFPLSACCYYRVRSKMLVQIHLAYLFLGLSGSSTQVIVINKNWDRNLSILLVGAKIGTLMTDGSCLFPSICSFRFIEISFSFLPFIYALVVLHGSTSCQVQTRS